MGQRGVKLQARGGGGVIHVDDVVVHVVNGRGEDKRQGWWGESSMDSATDVWEVRQEGRLSVRGDQGGKSRLHSVLQIVRISWAFWKGRQGRSSKGNRTGSGLFPVGLNQRLKGSGKKVLEL